MDMHHLLANLSLITLFKQLIACYIISFLILDAPRFKIIFGTLVRSSPIQSKIAAISIWTCWFISALLLFFSEIILINSLILLLLHYYFFQYNVTFKKTIFSFGVEGLFFYISSLYLVFIECNELFFKNETILIFILLLLKCELALILFSGGIQKIKLGFLKDLGFNYAYCNPKIGRWFYVFNRLQPKHLIFKIINICGTSLEILCGIFLFIPALSLLGTILIVFIFSAALFFTKIIYIPLLAITLSLLLFYQSGISLDLVSLFTHHNNLTMAESIFLILISLYALNCIFFSLLSYVPKPVIKNNRLLNLILSSKVFFLYHRFILSISISAHSFTVFSPYQTGMFFRIYEIDNENNKLKNIIFDGYSKHYRHLYNTVQNYYIGSRNIIRCSMPLILNNQFKDYTSKVKSTDILNFAQLFQTKNNSKLLIERFQLIDKDNLFYYLPLVEILIDFDNNKVSLHSKKQESIIPIQELNK